MRVRILPSALVAIVTLIPVFGTGVSPADVKSPDDAAEAAAVPAPIPDNAKWVNNPHPATPESIGNGKTIFSSQCTMCHGKSGDGKGDLAVRLGYDLPDFTSSAAHQSRTDGEYFYILTEGHGKMSGEGDRLGENVRWDLVNYIRSLGPPTSE